MTEHDALIVNRDPLGRCTFTVMTVNLWGGAHWDRRAPGVAELLRLREPDVLCVQELTLASRTVVDAALPRHTRADGDHPGYEHASTIWWRDDAFAHLENGVAEIDGLDHDRGLFWARLQPRLPQTPPLLVSTAHLTWQGDQAEVDDLVSRRVPQARQVVDHLVSLAPDGPAIFTADLNDVSAAHAALAEGGLCDSYAAVGQSMPATCPVPASLSLERPWKLSRHRDRAAAGFDVQYSRGRLRVRGSEVVEYFHDGTVVSDHYPVQVTYTL